MQSRINVAILGASGYTGAELLRLLAGHPHVNIAALTGDTQAGKPIEAVYPHLFGSQLPALVRHQEVDFTGIDLVFACLPHGETQAVIAELPQHLKIIDLSADFRLFDPALYETWYGHAHQAMHLQGEAVYGLTEHARAQVQKARLIANPGCYPTSALLPLLPLLKTRHILPEGIIIDSKSGITGAGRSAKQANLFAEIDGGLSAYGVASHRHAPEIEQSLGWAAGQDVRVSFTPHLIPMNRGILSTIYCMLSPAHSAADARHVLEQTYKHERFVDILPEGIMPSTHQVRGTNRCVINLVADRTRGRLIIISAIDNLVKGAAGQAVQNMNVMYHWPEDTALMHTAMFP
jgi:N-acetyl-gamma-glutamyl-phosphate reductase